MLLHKFCFWYGNTILFYILYLDARFLEMSSIEMIISRSNKETLQWLKEISWRGMTQEKLTGEADSYFGVVKTNRPETVRAKISDFVNKEHNMRQSLKFQIMRARNTCLIFPTHVC